MKTMTDIPDTEKARWGREVKKSGRTIRGEWRRHPNTSAIDLVIDGRDEGFGMRWRFQVIAHGHTAESLWIYGDADEAKTAAIIMAEALDTLRK